MNAVHFSTPTAVKVRPFALPRTLVGPEPIRHVHRERDFGVGYGNSSGYASPRRYTSNWAAPRFKLG